MHLEQPRQFHRLQVFGVREGLNARIPLDIPSWHDVPILRDELARCQAEKLPTWNGAGLEASSGDLCHNKGQEKSSTTVTNKRPSLPERVLALIQKLVAERGFSHEALAPHLGVGASAVSKLLNGKNAIGLDHLEGFSVALQMTPAELVLDPGSLIQPLTPLESQLLRHFRAMTDLQRHSLLAVLDRSPQEPKTKRRARWGRLELSEEQQLLVDLYARSEPQAREGVLKILKGTARQHDGPRRAHGD